MEEELYHDISLLEQKIELDARDQLDETIWDKPANDIITGIANNGSIPANRAIWELVQNARDVSKIGEKAKVFFIRKSSEFVFKHNGQPFDRKSLQSLIVQTSSKVRHDIVQVGQYGTGFLTTHKFGLRFHLQSSLNLKRGNRFYNFGVDNKFVIDRSSKDKTILSKAIKDVIYISQKWGTDHRTWHTTPLEETIFTYLHDHIIENTNVADAFEKSPQLAPYVLALNPLIGSISFVDEVDDCSEVYEYMSSEEDAKSGNTSIRSVIIKKTANNLTSEITLLLLQSSSEIEQNTGESKITVVLPCESIDGNKNTKPLTTETPQLYLYLPLLGTENWGWNYIIHAPSFTCDKDTRDSLLFVGNGQNNDEQAENNKVLIKLAGELIKDFIENQIDQYVDRKHFGKVNFLRDVNEKLKPYYNVLQKEWVSYFENQPLVKSGEGFINVSEIKVLDKEMYEACTVDEELLNALYTLLSKEEHQLILPEKEELIYWSQCTDEWYLGEENNPHAITLKEICDYAQSTVLTPSDIEWLLKLCQYVKDNPNQNIDLKKIVPNESLELSKIELVKPIGFNDTYKKAMMVLVPLEIEKFIHNSFYDILPSVKVYGFEEAKISITAFLGTLNNKQNALKATILSGEKWEIEDYQDSFIEPEYVNAILDIYKMLLPNDGTGFTTIVFELLTDFYSYSPTTLNELDKETFDIRTCYNVLLNDALYKFTLLEDKIKFNNWNLQIVKALYNFKDANSFLRNYLVYTNQLGEYCYAFELKKERNMPERLKVLYDIICRNVTDEDKSQSIYRELVSRDYAEYFIETGEIDGSALANEIQKPFLSDELRSIEKNPHQKLFVEIIEKFNDEIDGKIWSNLFDTINKIRPQLMLSVINSPQKRESIFQIMKVQDENKLKAIAELSKREDIDRIIELGKQSREIEIQDSNDFEFKKMLGSYVEDFLLEQLREALGEKSLTVVVDNEQVGQDLIVKIDNDPIYYIEVKSRWQSKNSVLMSTRQHQTSYENKDKYALCEVDMCDYDRELAKQHIYPDIKNVINRISVLENIGELNERMKDAVDGKEDKDVYIAYGYQVLVPQKVVERYGKSFNEFICNLETRINTGINKY